MSGLEDGSSDVTVRCANNGIWVEACPVTIRNCDVEVTGLYDRETASAGTCGRYGIYKPGSSSLTIAGHAKNGNTLTVKSTDDVISCPGSVTHISNCDVDMLLGGSDTETLTAEAGGEAYYKLTYDNANTTFGWYWGAEDGQPFTSPAHKAWLALPAGVEARFLSLPGYETTGIVRQAQTRQSAWHTMDGVRLDGQPTAKGIYIKDGKKVVKVCPGNCR